MFLAIANSEAVTKLVSHREGGSPSGIHSTQNAQYNKKASEAIENYTNIVTWGNLRSSITPNLLGQDTQDTNSWKNEK